MACYIFGAGGFYGLQSQPQQDDYVIAADGGWAVCQRCGIRPTVLMGDFDSLQEVPDFPCVKCFPVEKDDTDMMLAIKDALGRGETEFHLYGGMGGRRTDHTIANLQALLYLAKHGAQGRLYGDGEVYTALYNGTMTFEARPSGILSVFCLGTDAEGVSILGGKYEVADVTLSADFPLGVSNHFVGNPMIVSVKNGCLLIGSRNE